MKNNLQNEFGNIDVYLFDQLLKGRIDKSHKILDVGCGYGRNISYLINNGYNVFGIDKNKEAIEYLKESCIINNKNFPITNFLNCSIEEMPFQEDEFDFIICNAVLHFAENKRHFESMLIAIWKVLKTNGILFVRLASDIGIENLVLDIGEGRYLLPDGSERYLVNLDDLINYTNSINGKLVDPIKTTNVQNLRCMTTWCLTKL